MLLRRGGRPGLLGTIARTAVISGTATAVSGAVAQRQHARAAEQHALQQQAIPEHNLQQPQPAAPTAPTAPTAPSVDLVARLQQLGDLHRQGLLSAEEFTLAKQQLLRG